MGRKKIGLWLMLVWGCVFFFSIRVPAAAGPEEVLAGLLEGNRRFAAGKPIHPRQDRERRSSLVPGQNPDAVILSCSDSRVPPEVIFDQGLGDLFVVRVAGNTFQDFELGSIEYGAKVLKAPLIVVLGHDRCGAVEAALGGKALPGHIEAVAKRIDRDIQNKTCPTRDKLRCAIEANVRAVVDHLEHSRPVLAPLIRENGLKVVGARYDPATGRVELLE